MHLYVLYIHFRSNTVSCFLIHLLFTGRMTLASSHIRSTCQCGRLWLATLTDWALKLCMSWDPCSALVTVRELISSAVVIRGRDRCSKKAKREKKKQVDRQQIIHCMKGICKLSNNIFLSFSLSLRVLVECCIFLPSGFISAVPGSPGGAFPRCLLLLQDCFPLRGLCGKHGHSRLYPG